MSLTFDGANITEAREYAGDRFEGTALLIRDGDGKVTVVHEGYVLDRRGDGGLDICSADAWRRRGEAA